MATIMNYLAVSLGGVFAGWMLSFCFIRFQCDFFRRARWRNFREIIVSLMWGIFAFLLMVSALAVGALFLGGFYWLCWRDLAGRGEWSTGLTAAFVIFSGLGVIIGWRHRREVLKD